MRPQVDESAAERIIYSYLLSESKGVDPTAALAKAHIAGNLANPGTHARVLRNVGLGSSRAMEPDSRKQKRARADRAGASTLRQSSLLATFSREGPPPATALAYAASRRSRYGGTEPARGTYRAVHRVLGDSEAVAAKAAYDGAAHLSGLRPLSAIRRHEASHERRPERKE